MKLFVILFLCLLAVVLIACAVAVMYFENRRKRLVTSVLRTVSGEAPLPQATVLISPLEKRSWIDDVMSRFSLDEKLGTLISQAGLSWGVPQVLTACAVLACAGFAIGFRIGSIGIPMLSNLIVAALTGSLPILYLRHKRRQRLEEFEQQFPEALDFLARSMRAGHAFTASLEMLGEESPQPLGREFRQLFNEQNLGADLEVALANFARRVPLVDVRFFVSAIMLQKQTGGNLSEILVRISYVIRERFRLKGQVKAVSAHGRITAGILTVMPIVMTLALLIIAPGYLQSLSRDPHGRYMILGSIVAQAMGYLVIRRIINIKV
jgi:tight adherence protein B